MSWPDIRAHRSYAATDRVHTKTGRATKWYNCGLTVYDASRMGHACYGRDYATQDVLRRIMTEYFGYDVHFVMNITDIDDKGFIKLARQNHLLEKFRSDTSSSDDKLISQVFTAWRTLLRNDLAAALLENERLSSADTYKEVDIKFAHISELVERSDQQRLEAGVRYEFLPLHLKAGTTSQDILVLFPDEQARLRYVQLYQTSHTATDPSLSRNLASYWETPFFKDMRRLRIITFIDQIVKNGYAYESGGSVYFDTRAFDDARNHDYAKLEPRSKGKREDGTASTSIAVLGDNMDIHSGGIDLAFPHHANEMAQSEAYNDCPIWVNYFIHTGRLHIEGLKMSKSLKDFNTIVETLQKYTARQIRLAFMTQLWNAKVRNLENTLNVGDLEKELFAKLHECQYSFRVAFRSDVLRDLVSSRGKSVNVGVVENNARWIGRMLKMFGLGEGESPEIRWGQEGSAEEGFVNREEVLMPYLRTLSTFCDGVRQLAINKGECFHIDGKALIKLAPLSGPLKARDEKERSLSPNRPKRKLRMKSSG
ncbi:hypothetical protein F5878DRAFT_628686 [Lentinula raphanica]|uniref:tRNA synthetases class I catalytic domain-containing protein n=1 Tax=Lentinula raphanica TaxID=153919 RepID=A0AA38P2N4_9AGAR|nr:hypothetical protein F5878DRAFT_628686 [Lentinula raphanica]